MNTVANVDREYGTVGHALVATTIQTANAVGST